MLDLANRALLHAGAQSSTGDKDYVWGTPVALQSVIAGDILQFRNHEMTTTVTTDVTFDDGGGYEDTRVIPLPRKHHTAIVETNKGAFGLVVLEQNVDPGGKKVQRNALPLWSPAPVVKTEFRNMKDAAGKTRRAKVVVTTTTTVTSTDTIRAYRPRAKS